MEHISSIVNPLTPTAYLPPSVAFESSIATYVVIGSVAALIWDILMNVDGDYRLLVEHRISFPTSVYFLSRLATFSSTFLNAVFLTGSLGKHCQTVKKAQCVFYHLAFSSTALLFFFRVRAVFNQNKYIVIFFFALWLSVFGGSLTAATVGGATHLGPTSHCIPHPFKQYLGASPLTLAANDTAVFLAISWRLLVDSWSDRRRKRSFLSLVFGGYLPTFSKAILNDGQVYYMISVASNLVAVMLTFYPGRRPGAYLFMFTFNSALTNMMACRVFRRTKFGDFREESISSSHLAAQIEAMPIAGHPINLATPHADGGRLREGLDSGGLDNRVNEDGSNTVASRQGGAASKPTMLAMGAAHLSTLVARASGVEGTCHKRNGSYINPPADDGFTMKRRRALRSLVNSLVLPAVSFIAYFCWIQRREGPGRTCLTGLFEKAHMVQHMLIMLRTARPLRRPGPASST
ncbi:hypothetical protein Hypma_009754 [Hypsizygus marmoreus]|uniref:Uncharacterized protein n=1 Tax=Hypsizygus marmoreus TaxID=39966 RepID=A0A369JPG8_HYPMA|nr:hypothetical protein Hypma_009754 [Hypsizygus marmoreus]